MILCKGRHLKSAAAEEENMALAIARVSGKKKEIVSLNIREKKGGGERENPLYTRRTKSKNSWGERKRTSFSPSSEKIVYC